jgi:hypothetical protein
MFFVLFRTDAGTIESLSKDNKHIKYAENISCVVKISGKYDAKTSFYASAVVIHPHWVVTAAHIAKGATECYITIDDKKYCLDAIIYHKDFNDNNFGFSDIAMGYCKEPIEIDFYPDLYTEEDEIGKNSCICGYGTTGTFATGSTISDGKKRAGSNYVDKIDRDLLICTPSRPGSNKHTSLEFLISHGDSGGGLFIDKKLAGINSCVIADDKDPNSSYGDESGHTRISKYISWIQYIMETNDETQK